jgi:molybdopterin converting factor small subunit
MATLTLRYFAAAAEAAGCEQESIDAVGNGTLADLRRFLESRYGEPMRQVLSAGSFLVDGTVRTDDVPVRGSTVDVLPPFAGG